MSRFWYSYDAVGDPFALSSYRRQTRMPGCLNGPIICSILAPGGDIYPSHLSNNMQQYIADGLASTIAEPSLPPGSKIYVYFKGLSL